MYEMRRWDYWAGEYIRFNCNIFNEKTGEVVFKQGDVIKWEDFKKIENVCHANYLMDSIDLRSHKDED